MALVTIEGKNRGQLSILAFNPGTITRIFELNTRDRAIVRAEARYVASYLLRKHCINPS